MAWSANFALTEFPGLLIYGRESISIRELEDVHAIGNRANVGVAGCFSGSSRPDAVLSKIWWFFV
jgi:hypothetical protein